MESWCLELTLTRISTLSRSKYFVFWRGKFNSSFMVIYDSCFKWRVGRRITNWKGITIVLRCLSTWGLARDTSCSWRTWGRRGGSWPPPNQSWWGGSPRGRWSKWCRVNTAVSYILWTCQHCKLFTIFVFKAEFKIQKILSNGVRLKHYWSSQSDYLMNVNCIEKSKKKYQNFLKTY